MALRTDSMGPKKQVQKSARIDPAGEIREDVEGKLFLHVFPDEEQSEEYLNQNKPGAVKVAPVEKEEKKEEKPAAKKKKAKW